MLVGGGLRAAVRPRLAATSPFGHKCTAGAGWFMQAVGPVGVAASCSALACHVLQAKYQEGRLSLIDEEGNTARITNADTTIGPAQYGGACAARCVCVCCPMGAGRCRCPTAFGCWHKCAPSASCWPGKSKRGCWPAALSWRRPRARHQPVLLPAAARLSLSTSTDPPPSTMVCPDALQ